MPKTPRERGTELGLQLANKIRSSPACCHTAPGHVRLPVHPSPPSPRVHPPLSLAVHHPCLSHNLCSSSIPLLPRNSVGRGGPTTTWLLLPLPHPSTPWTAAKTPAAGLGWRKGRDRQEGRCLHPFPQKHVLHREKQCHAGPAAGGEGGGRALDMGLAKPLPGRRRPLVPLCPDCLCDLSSAPSIPTFQL